MKCCRLIPVAKSLVFSWFFCFSWHMLGYDLKTDNGRPGAFVILAYKMSTVTSSYQNCGQQRAQLA